MPTLHSHKHCQAPRANAKAKACQRVCLSHAEKKELKIPFPSNNLVNSTIVHLINFSAWGRVSASKPPLCHTRNCLSDKV